MFVDNATPIDDFEQKDTREIDNFYLEVNRSLKISTTASSRSKKLARNQFGLSTNTPRWRSLKNYENISRTHVRFSLVKM